MKDELLLFSYGTLQQSEVQRALFGRALDSSPDAVRGFVIESVTITDPDVIRTSGSDRHPILTRGKDEDEVRGSALALTRAELLVADGYESPEYARTEVTLASGRNAFVYLAKSDLDPAHVDQVEFVRPEPELFSRLLPVARQIFTETFAHSFDDAAFAAFCDDVYRPGGSMAREFELTDVQWLVAVWRGEPIGYAKLTPLRAPAAKAAPGALELQQIYVLGDWHGRGVAGRLMDWAIEEARRKGAPELYLTVFDHNHRAKRFYTRYGFEDVGHCTFELGGEIFDDRIWRRGLS